MNKNKILKFFNIAKNASMNSTWHKQKIGSVIVCSNEVLTIGWNSNKETSIQKKYNRFRNFDCNSFPNYTHAEMDALLKLKKLYNLKTIDFSKVAIFIYRERKDTGIALAKPCPACEAAIKSMGIKNVFYTGNGSLINELYLKNKKKLQI